MIKKINYAIIITILLIVIATAFSLPSSPLDFYTPHHTANLFLPNYGYESQYSTQPNVYPTLLLYYNYYKVILELVSGDIMKYTHLCIIIDIIISITSLILISYFFTQDYKLSLMLGLFLGFTSTYKGMLILMFVLSLYFVLKYITTHSRNSIYASLLIFFYGIGVFYWHSLSMALLLIVLSILWITYLNTRFMNGWNFSLDGVDNRYITSHIVYTSLLCIIIVVISWVYIRTRQFHIVLTSSNILELIDLKYLLHIAINKGSDLPSEYNYMFHFVIPLGTIDFGRYLTYLIIYIYISFLAINYMRGKNKPQVIVLLLFALFIADVFLKLFYYTSTGIINVAITINLILPVFLIYLLIETRSNVNQQITGKVIKYSIILLIIVTLTLTTVSSLYTERTQYPSGVTNFESYTSSIYWLVNHAKDNKAQVITDADTGGYWQIIYVKEKLYYYTDIQIGTLSEHRYKQLSFNNTESYGPTTLIFNKKIEDRNLAFFSLEGWKIFKPIPKVNYDKNFLLSSYNDGTIIIYLNPSN